MPSFLGLLLFAASGIQALKMASVVAPGEFKRDATSGGWAAQVVSSNCPAGSTLGGNGACCPRSLVHTATGVDPLCCPPGMDEIACFNVFSKSPTCADDSWVLWNTTTQGEYNGFFCCTVGQIGDVNGYCHEAGEDVNSDLWGITLSYKPVATINSPASGAASGTPSAAATTTAPATTAASATTSASPTTGASSTAAFTNTTLSPASPPKGSSTLAGSSSGTASASASATPTHASSAGRLPMPKILGALVIARIAYMAAAYL